MLCVLILYISSGTYSIKSTPNDRFLRNYFMAGLFTLIVFARNLLRGNRRKNTFRILFWCLAWDSDPGFTSNKPKYYLLDHSGETFMIANSVWAAIYHKLFHLTVSCMTKLLSSITIYFRSSIQPIEIQHLHLLMRTKVMETIVKIMRGKPSTILFRYYRELWNRMVHSSFEVVIILGNDIQQDCVIKTQWRKSKKRNLEMYTGWKRR